MGNTIKNILVWVVGGAMLLAAFNALSDKQEDKQQIEYSQFIQQVNSGEVSNVNIEGSVVSGYAGQSVLQPAACFVVDRCMVLLHAHAKRRWR